MRVKLYTIDQSTGAESKPQITDTYDVFGGDDNERYAAHEELQRSGRYWGGGGAAPLFYLQRQAE